MERIISEQDRIRRAEAIANRRREKISIRSINISNEKRKMSPFAKMCIQTIVSICIFGIAYFLIQHNSPVIEDVKSILEYNIDFEQIYNKGNNLLSALRSYMKEEDTVKKQVPQEPENIVKKEENGTKENENNEISEGIGGSREEVNLSQDEQDIEYIKEKISLIVPTNGTVTSGYGAREATDIISANHAGVDIGAATGTEIRAAMEGTVELVSDYGDYGNHVKITNGEISTLYAHCNSIFVNEGDYVMQGQKIAEVGNTGRTTGPHLHFEVIRDNRKINPQAVLEI